MGNHRSSATSGPLPLSPSYPLKTNSGALGTADHVRLLGLLSYVCHECHMFCLQLHIELSICHFSIAMNTICFVFSFTGICHFLSLIICYKCYIYAINVLSSVVLASVAELPVNAQEGSSSTRRRETATGLQMFSARVTRKQ